MRSALRLATLHGRPAMASPPPPVFTGTGNDFPMTNVGGPAHYIQAVLSAGNTYAHFYVSSFDDSNYLEVYIFEGNYTISATTGGSQNIAVNYATHDFPNGHTIQVRTNVSGDLYLEDLTTSELIQFVPAASFGARPAGLGMRVGLNSYGGFVFGVASYTYGRI